MARLIKLQVIKIKNVIKAFNQSASIKLCFIKLLIAATPSGTRAGEIQPVKNETHHTDELAASVDKED